MGRNEVREFVEEVLRTGFALIDVLGAILDELPEDAFPGEAPADAVLDMLVGSLQPVAEAAGRDTVRQATALLAATRDRTFIELRAAAAIAAD